ncbi:unnamed protein product [Heligmosomoides polygyrus]|uniref:Late endosomal/lysosomal adaptor and MAPK and MTOR activator 5 n=1 Tax=Heligmosomoides polygyrus TaxID=6339 RepID=A0A183G9G1_HELPZ|nr:unnamed protein product [Heligmosomoides polygyrus]
MGRKSLSRRTFRCLPSNGGSNHSLRGSDHSLTSQSVPPMLVRGKIGVGTRGRRLRQGTAVFVDCEGTAVVADSVGRRIHVTGLFIKRSSIMAVCDRNAYNSQLNIYCHLQKPAEEEWD